MDTLSNILNIHVQNINWQYINQNPYFNNNVTIYKSLFKNKKRKIDDVIIVSLYRLGVVLVTPIPP